jgi:transcriptional regulator with XRE-family HTH domain
VPRHRAINKKDLEIAKRVRLMRKAQKCSRAFLATKSGTHHQAIVRIEIGRTPLKYGLATRLVWALSCNPAWLATGKGKPDSYFRLPDAKSLGVHEDACFSDVFEQHLAPAFDCKSGLIVTPGSEPEIRYSSAMMLRGFIDEWFCEVPDGYVQELTGEIQAHVANLLAKWPTDSGQMVLARKIWFKQLADILQHTNNDSAQKSALDDVTANGNHTNVKEKLPTLLARLNKATSGRGAKSALAKYMGVPLPNVSQWLSGDREPSGETTLQLLNWVEHQERKK